MNPAAPSSFFSPDGVMAAVAVLGLLGTIAGFYLRRVDREQEKDAKTQKEAQEKEAKAQKEAVDRQDKVLADMKNEFERRIEGLKTEHDRTEQRLAQVERTYISRADHAEFRVEMMAAVRDVGERVSRSIDGLGARVGELVERVAKVEAEH